MTDHLTFVGTATVILELGGLRFITDPVFDPPGQTHRVGRMGWGRAFRYTRLQGPALPVEQVGPIDVVLLSHDHHADNLDSTGRSLLPGAKAIYTTVAGARRLKRSGLAQAHGLSPGQRVELPGPAGPVTLTAAPAQHGPAWISRMAGPVIGFFLEHLGRRLYLSGDTLWHSALAHFAETHVPEVALIHLGAATFGPTGPIRYSANLQDFGELAMAWPAAQLVPIHFEGWSHFKQGPSGSLAPLQEGPWSERVRTLRPGQRELLWRPDETQES